MKQARCLWDPDVRPCVRYCNGCEDLVWEDHPITGAKRHICALSGRIPGNQADCPKRGR